MILDASVVVELEASMALARDNEAIRDELEPALAAIGVEFIEADHAIIRIATEARLRFPLNFGDWFAYAHARVRDEMLLTLDADFLETDLERVLHPKRTQV